jgi:hypothetical protein
LRGVGKISSLIALRESPVQAQRWPGGGNRKNSGVCGCGDNAAGTSTGFVVVRVVFIDVNGHAMVWLQE